MNYLYMPDCALTRPVLLECFIKTYSFLSVVYKQGHKTTWQEGFYFVKNDVDTLTYGISNMSVLKVDVD